MSNVFCFDFHALERRTRRTHYSQRTRRVAMPIHAPRSRAFTKEQRKNWTACLWPWAFLLDMSPGGCLPPAVPSVPPSSDLMRVAKKKKEKTNMCGQTSVAKSARGKPRWRGFGSKWPCPQTSLPLSGS